ncbi:uncharacterized protein LOC142536918 isoform X2 [Primulina tabacum]|uniref:uncharacterized protein LOC142536918 isoform X2 n=1 Tax=Primulina tabacum TaxID=48773 RepID=UPI003F5A6263
MASNNAPTFAYTIIYAADVEKSVAFYAKAFGCEVRRVDKSRRWGELQSGNTTLAFTPVKQRETDELTGKVKIPQHERNPIERAVENGALAVSEPEEKEWGQKVGYVRDIDGNVVRIGSHVRQ